MKSNGESNLKNYWFFELIDSFDGMSWRRKEQEMKSMEWSGIDWISRLAGGQQIERLTLLKWNIVEWKQRKSELAALALPHGPFINQRKQIN